MFQRHIPLIFDKKAISSPAGGVIESFISSWMGQVRPYRAVKRNVPGWTVGPGKCCWSVMILGDELVGWWLIYVDFMLIYVDLWLIYDDGWFMLI